MTAVVAIIPQVAERVATYSATDLVTIIAAVGVLIGSILTGVVTIIATLRNGQKTDKLTTAVVGDEKTQGLKEQVMQIHTVTNSNLSAANAKIDKQSEQLRAMAEMIQELKNEREKKEIAAATLVVPVTPMPTSGAPVAPVIVVENVTAESVTADTVHAGILTTGAVKEKEKT